MELQKNVFFEVRQDGVYRVVEAELGAGGGMKRLHDRKIADNQDEFRRHHPVEFKYLRNKMESWKADSAEGVRDLIASLSDAEKGRLERDLGVHLPRGNVLHVKGTPLPNDFPSRRSFVKGGIRTVEDIVAHEDLTQIPGVGVRVRDQALLEAERILDAQDEQVEDEEGELDLADDLNEE